MGSIFFVLILSHKKTNWLYNFLLSTNLDFCVSEYWKLSQTFTAVKSKQEISTDSDWEAYPGCRIGAKVWEKERK